MLVANKLLLLRLRACLLHCRLWTGTMLIKWCFIILSRGSTSLSPHPGLCDYRSIVCMVLRARCMSCFKWHVSMTDFIRRYVCFAWSADIGKFKQRIWTGCLTSGDVQVQRICMSCSDDLQARLTSRKYACLALIAHSTLPTLQSRKRKLCPSRNRDVSLKEILCSMVLESFCHHRHTLQST